MVSRKLVGAEEAPEPRAERPRDVNDDAIREHDVGQTLQPWRRASGNTGPPLGRATWATEPHRRSLDRPFGP